MRRILIPLVIAIVSVSSFPISGQSQPTAGLPRVEIRKATTLLLPGDVDSNSPAVWDRVNGQRRLFVMTSFAGRPSTASGLTMNNFSAAKPIALEPWPPGGVWMEALIADVDGTWYGYYHLEQPATAVCPGAQKVVPSIGAARSRDKGATWENLGIVLAAPSFSHDCSTNDRYNVGGVGDFSVQLDEASQDLYIFFSQYVRWSALQGVGVARIAWADRDQPSRRVSVWQNTRWVPAATMRGPERWIASALPILPVGQPWHDQDTIVDAFWGPSVHWNTYLQRYVMLLNRSKDTNWSQEGIYVSFNDRLDEPGDWTTPVRILRGGSWYPQVIGLETGVGTDKLAGEHARFFLGGTSTNFIRFIK